MDRRQFKLRLAASLDSQVELGRTTREHVRRAADTSKTTVQSWFNVETSSSVRDDDRLPDSHDLHLLAMHLPDVAEPLLKLLVESSVFCVERGSGCGPRRTLDQGTDAIIADIDDYADLIKRWRRAIEDGRLTAAEAAPILAVLRKRIGALQDLDRWIGSQVQG